MDELRVVRRENQSLIVANDAGEEFRLFVDSSALAELRHLARQPSEGSKVSPREIQSLVRAGKTRAEIAQLTGADEIDIERYEEPVLAERRFILSSAQSVPVRANPADQQEQEFGTVIAERLIGLNARNIEWSSWRDEEAGWMIGLAFDSYDVSHRAVWSFEHRKNVLAPISPDATTLSKLGDVGDRLIPKLRAVDATEDAEARFDSGAFDKETLLPEPSSQQVTPELHEETNPNAVSAATEAAIRAGHPSTGSIPIIDVDAEFARRREIDQLAIKTPAPEAPDLGQTADLLDALRRRRTEREEFPSEPQVVQPELPAPVPLHLTDEPVDAPPASAAPDLEVVDDITEPQDSSHKTSEPSKRRGRTSIPSWDDILFGTRSEEDPK